MNERIIINMVLSKLDFYPNHYKIIKKNNKIYIKCHFYTLDCSHYLDNPSFYINITNIYDTNLNINNNIPNHYFLPFYQNLANKEKKFRCNYIKPFNIIITNDKETLILKPIITQLGEHPNTIMEVSKDIDIEPHINNHISINKITGLLI